jgi:hypothetical protein
MKAYPDDHNRALKKDEEVVVSFDFLYLLIETFWISLRCDIRYQRFYRAP